MKSFGRIITAALGLIFFGTVFAWGIEPQAITSPQELLELDPKGTYKLECDLDMSEIEWIPKEFSGSIDGQGHTIYNLRVKQPGKETRTVYDGNYKEYDTHFAGMFSILAEGAKIENLNLAGAAVIVQDYPDPIFSGLLAGCMDGSEIINCNLQGYLELTTGGRCFGCGGAAGYGRGSIRGCTVDTVQVSIDLDKENRDEQFMGGAYGAGYIDLDDNLIKIQGYDSDHGYVHSGGLVGMYIIYPKGSAYTGYITNTRAEGTIHFFEDNKDRRAYCAPYIGEVMQWTYNWGGCSEAFTRDETKDYSRELRPCMDGGPSNKTITEPTFESIGFTDYSCESCGFSYRADYRLPLPKEIHLVDTDALQQIEEEIHKDDPNIKNLGLCIGIALLAVLVLAALVISGRRGRH